MLKKPPTYAVWRALCDGVPYHDRAWTRLARYLHHRFGVPDDYEPPYDETVSAVWRLSVWSPAQSKYCPLHLFMENRYMDENYSLSRPLLRLKGKKLPFNYQGFDFFVAADPFAVDVVVTTPPGRVIDDPEVREYAEAKLHFLASGA